MAESQIVVSPILLDTPAGEARGWSAEVDLRSPQVLVRVGCRESASGSAGRVALVETPTWAESAGVAVAINANYFSAKSDGSADIVGLCVVDGVEVSPPRCYEGVSDPVLLVLADGSAVVSSGTPEESRSSVRTAVAGVGGSPTSEVRGTLLVRDGEAMGTTARVQPEARHPRTAAGVSEDGRTLYLVVIDGRQEGWSVGVTLPELAELLAGMGADDAVNLDGGGSSSFVSFVGGEKVVNRPSDGVFRPVAVSLGIELLSEESAEEAG
ncbi:MAG: phosphodiester glycosidase family protein [Phycisphaerales bacterium]